MKHRDLSAEEKRLYYVYRNMCNRCYRKDGDDVARYSKRGIKVFEEWLEYKQGWKRFIKWAIKNGARKGLILDRENNDGDYSPDNCRFVTPLTSANNTSKNRIVNYEGKTYTFSEFWREFAENGIKTNTANWRLLNGYSLIDAVTLPLMNTTGKPVKGFKPKRIRRTNVMARTPNPNKEKIVALKAEIKEHEKAVKLGVKAETKLETLNEKLEKLTGATPAPAKKTAKVEAKPAKKSAKTEEKTSKKSKAAEPEKKRGRPKKDEDEKPVKKNKKVRRPADEDDDE